MKMQGTMQAHQLQKFAPVSWKTTLGFHRCCFGEDALVCGFQVGESFLGIDEMDTMIASQPHLDAKEAALLLAPSGARSREL